MKSFAWEVIGTALLVLGGMFIYWASNDELQCEYAEAEMRAFGLCLLDEGCIRTPDDYKEVNYWRNVKHGRCGEENEEKVEPTSSNTTA